MPSDFNSKMRSDPATPETSASDQKKVSESPESEAISGASGASGEPVASGGSVVSGGSVEGVAPGGSTFSDSSSSQVLNGGVPAGANSGLVQKSDGIPNVDGGDASVTRTLSPEEQDEKNLPFAMLSDVKIDGDMLDLGVIFDEYELIRFIGGGGMGNVWLAQDSNLNRLVALKVLHSDKSANREVIQRFYSEAQVSAMLNHPNISQIYAFRDHRDTHRMFLTMEYIEGENLRDRVKNSGVLKVSETVWIAIQITHALIHMAKFNVVHRDIKPSNILLTEKGEAKLIDFGLARIIAAPAESEKQVEGAGQADITASGVTLGTFDYISPEQARDPRMVDSRSDIYSLGCTLYYLLTGHPPFPQGNSLQKLLQHQSDNPMDVRLARVDVPESLNEILNKTMKKKPEERYATPEELLADLEMMAQELGLRFRGPTVDLQLEEAPEVKSETPGLLKRYVLPHLFWLVPLIVFLFAIWFLQRTWTPAPSELELPPAPVEEI